MTDVGRYDAHEAELRDALVAAAIPAVTDIDLTLSLEDLVAREVLRDVSIGICDAGADAVEPPAIGSRLVRTRVQWEISVMVRNARGAAAGRPVLRRTLEAIRDTVHGLKSSAPAGTRYRWVSDRPQQIGDAQLCGAIATFELATHFGS